MSKLERQNIKTRAPKITFFDNFNDFNNVNLDQLCPLKSWGTRPGIRPNLNFSPPVKCHFGTLVLALWTTYRDKIKQCITSQPTAGRNTPLFYSISRKPTLRIANIEGIAYMHGLGHCISLIMIECKLTLIRLLTRLWTIFSAIFQPFLFIS